MIGLLNAAGAAWAAYFGPAVAQNTVFLGLVFVALFLTRHAPARIRYLIALVGMIKLLVPPFVPLRIPEPVGPILVPLTALLPDAAPQLTGTVAQPVTTPAAQLDVLGMLFAVWLSVALIAIIGSGVSTLRLRQRLRHATDISTTLPEETIAELNTPVLESFRIAIPITFGLFAPRIFVPAAWRQWTDDRRALVLRHEAAHIRRRDAAAQLLQLVVQALYFFHPLVWILSRRLNEYREMACDDVAAGVVQDDRLRYSRHLTDIAESAILSPLTSESASALLRRKHELLSRIKYQIEEEKMKPFSRIRIGFVTVTLMLLLVPLSAYVQPSGLANGDRAATETSASQAKDDGMRTITLGIAGADKVAVDGKDESFAKVGEELLGLVGEDREHTVIRIVCEKDTRMGSVFDIHQILRKMDLLKVSYLSADIEMPLVLPSKELEQKTKEIPKQHIADVEIAANGQLLLDGKAIANSQLAETVKQRLADNPMLIVSVHAARDARYEDYVATLDRLRSGGARRIFVNIPAS